MPKLNCFQFSIFSIICANQFNIFVNYSVLSVIKLYDNFSLRNSLYFINLQINYVFYTVYSLQTVHTQILSLSYAARVAVSIRIVLCCSQNFCTNRPLSGTNDRFSNALRLIHLKVNRRIAMNSMPLYRIRPNENYILISSLFNGVIVIINKIFLI